MTTCSNLNATLVEPRTPEQGAVVKRIRGKKVCIGISDRWIEKHTGVTILVGKKLSVNLTLSDPVGR